MTKFELESFVTVWPLTVMALGSNVAVLVGGKTTGVPLIMTVDGKAPRVNICEPMTVRLGLRGSPITGIDPCGADDEVVDVPCVVMGLKEEIWTGEL